MYVCIYMYVCMYYVNIHINVYVHVDITHDPHVTYLQKRIKLGWVIKETSALYLKLDP